jgi:hypothetical protein
MKASDKHQEKLLSVPITGHEEQWARVQERILSIVDSVAKRIDNMTGSSNSNETDSSTTVLLKDIIKIAAEWLRAKIEKITLENVKLTTEISSEVAEEKRRIAEVARLEAEAQKIQADALRIEFEILEQLLNGNHKGGQN